MAKKVTVVNGKKTTETPRQMAVKMLKRKEHITQEQAERRYADLYRKISKQTRNYNKITESKHSAAEIVRRYATYGTADDLVRSITALPATNPQKSKAQAGGDLERYAKSTTAKLSQGATLGYYDDFVRSLQTAGQGSNLWRIWGAFFDRAVNDSSTTTAERKENAEKVRKFWRRFELQPRGLYGYITPPDLIYTASNLSTLIQDIKAWKRDYTAGGAGGDGTRRGGFGS